MKRYTNYVKGITETDLPADPRIIVFRLDQALSETEIKARRLRWQHKRIKPNQAKIDAHVAKRRENKKIKKVVREARKEHKYRKRAGLPFDPDIDVKAREAKIALGWKPPKKGEEGHTDDEEIAEGLERLVEVKDDGNIVNLRTANKPAPELPFWKQAKKEKKLAKQIAKKERQANASKHQRAGKWANLKKGERPARPA